MKDWNNHELIQDYLRLHSQSELAEKVQLTPSAISKIVKSKREVYVDCSGAYTQLVELRRLGKHGKITAV
jgi:hypothetical protein